MWGIAGYEFAENDSSRAPIYTLQFLSVSGSVPLMPVGHQSCLKRSWTEVEFERNLWESEVSQG